MKKLLTTFVVAILATVSVKAQVYVGGGVGFASIDDETTYKIVPEIGYSLNQNWALGISLGISKGPAVFGLDSDCAEQIEVTPYARYTFFRSGDFSVFCDGVFQYISYKADGEGIGHSIGIGVMPGLAYNVSKFTFAAHVGYLGYSNFKPKYGNGVDAFGLALDGRSITVGAYYNF